MEEAGTGNSGRKPQPQPSTSAGSGISRKGGGGFSRVLSVETHSKVQMSYA